LWGAHESPELTLVVEGGRTETPRLSNLSPVTGAAVVVGDHEREQERGCDPGIVWCRPRIDGDGRDAAVAQQSTRRSWNAHVGPTSMTSPPQVRCSRRPWRMSRGRHDSNRALLSMARQARPSRPSRSDGRLISGSLSDLVDRFARSVAGVSSGARPAANLTVPRRSFLWGLSREGRGPVDQIRKRAPSPARLSPDAEDMPGRPARGDVGRAFHRTRAS
jgi:hypothetical protein